MQKKIKWKIDGIFNADPVKCYAEFPEVVTPKNVLEVARDESAELHKCFDWNDSSAAEKYRITQARDVIRSLVVVEVRKDEKNSQPRRLLERSSVPHTYETRVFFQKNEDEYKILLERARRVLEGFRTRFKNIAELETVNEAIDEFLTA